MHLTTSVAESHGRFTSNCRKEVLFFLVFRLILRAMDRKWFLRGLTFELNGLPKASPFERRVGRRFLRGEQLGNIALAQHYC